MNTNTTTSNFTQKNYVDQFASVFFKYNGATAVSYSPKVITRKADGVRIPLIHISGMDGRTGQVINFDMFPRTKANASNAVCDDILKGVDDLIFRIGQFTETVVNPETGEVSEVTTTGTKALCYIREGALYPIGEMNEDALNDLFRIAKANNLASEMGVVASAE